MSGPLNPVQSRLVKIECLRGMMTGPVTSAASGNGILFLVAISYFQFADHAKSLLASSMHCGLILSILILPILSKLRLPINRIIPCCMCFAALCLFLASQTDDKKVYLWVVMCGVFSLMLISPMLTGLWREQMPGHLRGRMFGRVSLITMIANLIFAYLAALYIGEDISRFRPVVVYFSIALIIAAVCAWFLPGQRLIANKQNPFSLLKLLWQDKLFGYISLTWMFLGLGNLASIPLRAEYVTKLGYSPDWVLLLIAVIPPAGAICSTLVWGILFDRLNFILLRIGINVFFCVSILLFFQESLFFQCLGSICFGIGQGGGSVAWNLWVTKFSPPERTADYQSVHAFLTGIRGVSGPFAAYALWQAFSFQSVIWMCAALIALSCLMLLPVIPHGRRLN